MKSILFGLAALSAALGSVPAQAHVVLDKADARIGKTFKSVLAVPHGCEGAATVRLTVQIPEGLIAVKPMPKPGWTIDVKKGAYARAYHFFHGAQLSDGVKEISWSGRLEDGFYDEFTFTGFVADTFKAGDVLPIPVVQDCETGTAKWVELAAPGQDPHALKYPAPLLRLTSAEPPPRGVAKGDITVSSGWSRATPGGAKIGAGYVTLTNTGREPDRLVSVSADIAESVEIHEMSTRDGVMVMRPIEEGLALPPGQTVTLTSGGMHLMLTGLKAPLVEGKSVAVTLQFERAGKMAVLLDVLGVGAQGPGQQDGAKAEHAHH
ncbi:conserved hypothetical protein; putative signal peptide; putative Nuclear export factor GLE1 domain (PF07987);Copper chaperone PCuAC (IPR007410) [Bradyrhizobium sp. ORS 285]|uniref:DUF1775 domain-containing protein n=1 Tax=Bradyrhizobium sp. ORS 285 TaxID=115808 RepID=UPI0002407ED6|nr:DUF1775 domain-containing protein [Bradyrhizobium sp. ORS 285]CCD87983.1 conserved exported hypothetical protein [Bradyrhizobium sp. ORS 285]SMX57234.1 conserved hypothetical protein; putative signal peptide; putative Nuclear export factor GLE1 domain (PF07987);Copper chaperone PCuAC (IPR007410) [Bradyrhizobium sp. ORS 285]